MQPSRAARGRVGVVVGALACLVAALLGPARPTSAQPPAGDAAGPLVDLAPSRIAGDDRVATAAVLARRAFPSGAPAAVVATSAGEVDALAAAGLAGALGGPLLLTPPDRLPDEVVAALDVLAVQRVVVLGGTAVVGPQVEDALEDRGVDVDRVHGDGREATAAAAARALVEAAGDIGRFEGRRAVLVAAADAPVDAIAAGALAFAERLPILLVHRDGVPAATADALEQLGPDLAVVLGGTNAVGDGVVADLERRGASVRRVAGDDRTATAVAVADLRPSGRRVLIARGDAPADALAGAPFAAREGASVLLTVGPDDLGGPAAEALAHRCGTGQALTVLGGPAAVAPAVLDAALRAVHRCGAAGEPLVVGYALAVEPSTGEDPAAFAAAVAEVLADARGWGGGALLRFAPASDPHDLGLLLVSEGSLTAHGCAGATGCRLGGDVLVSARAWVSPPAGWDLAGWRTAVLQHLVGRWLGEPAARDCGGAPSVLAALDDASCPLAPLPTAGERERVLDRYVPQVTFAFGGDVHGEGPVRSRLLAGGNPLAAVAPVLADADVAMVNLETPVSVRGAPEDKTYTFRAPPELIPALVEAGVDVVSLANNHALDYGRVALLDTLDAAAAAGLQVVGAGRNATEAYAPVVIGSVAGDVAVIGLSRVLHTQAWVAGADRPGVASAYDEAAAAAAVRHAASVAPHVVVQIHWGIERADCPDTHQRRLARLLVDAGADVIVGHHPHVLQGVQELGGALVAYSTGNFVWYHNRQPSGSTGVLRTALPRVGAGWDLVPALIDAGGSPVPVGGAEAERIEARVRDRSPGGAVGCAFPS